MRFLLALAVLAALSTLSPAQFVERVEILEPGIYEAKIVAKNAVPGTVSGTVNTVTRPELVDATTVVPARIGTRFGFRFRVVGNDDAGYTLKLVTIVPGPGLRNPTTGNITVRGEEPLVGKVGLPQYRGFRFDHPWELAIGTWTFEIWDGNRKLASQNFKVVAP
jgi:hypothetical protein